MSNVYLIIITVIKLFNQIKNKQHRMTKTLGMRFRRNSLSRMQISYLKLIARSNHPI